MFTSRVWVDAALSGRLGSSLIAFLFYVAFLIFLVMGQSTGNVALIYAFFFFPLFLLCAYFHISISFVLLTLFLFLSFSFFACLSSITAFYHQSMKSPGLL